ncbi:MAG: tyrosine/phenylalanine carboxypeptidase domain-containing protein [Candidatus Woesearchaeota archaeon]
MNKELHDIDRKLCAIQKTLFSHSYIRVQNYDEEFEKFCDSQFQYNPQFTYKKLRVERVIQKLEQISIPQDTKWSAIFEEFRLYLLEYAYILEKVGTDQFHTLNFFGNLTHTLIKKAEESLQGVKRIAPKVQSEKISAEKLGEILLGEVQKIGGFDWTVQYKDSASATVSIHAAKKQITIRKKAFFSEKRVQKLLVHEIHTHVKRSICGAKQPFGMFQIGLPGYIATEEGLAKYNEVQAGVTNSYFTKLQALLVLATDKASRSSFVELFSFVQQYIHDVKKAFRFCARIKRGMSDTSKPGGFLKDHIYFQGLLEIEDFVAHGGNIHELYVGKVSLDFLKKYKDVLQDELVWP